MNLIIDKITKCPICNTSNKFTQEYGGRWTICDYRSIFNDTDRTLHLFYLEFNDTLVLTLGNPFPRIIIEKDLTTIMSLDYNEEKDQFLFKTGLLDDNKINELFQILKGVALFA